MERRKAWKAGQPELAGNLVFPDGSGVNINMARRYGRAVGRARVVDHAPVNTPTNTTVISAITVDGPRASATWEGGTTKARFLDWLENTLAPTLRPGDIVVMDNLAAHHSKGVAEILEKAGASVMYLPPYSPDLNPIEEMWSKMKTFLREARIRVLDRLAPAVGGILRDRISPADCRGWFGHDGYLVAT